VEVGTSQSRQALTVDVQSHGVSTNFVGVVWKCRKGRRERRGRGRKQSETAEDSCFWILSANSSDSDWSGMRGILDDVLDLLFE